MWLIDIAPLFSICGRTISTDPDLIPQRCPACFYLTYIALLCDSQHQKGREKETRHVSLETAGGPFAVSIGSVPAVGRAFSNGERIRNVLWYHHLRLTRPPTKERKTKKGRGGWEVCQCGQRALPTDFRFVSITTADYARNYVRPSDRPAVSSNRRRVLCGIKLSNGGAHRDASELTGAEKEKEQVEAHGERKSRTAGFL